MAAANILSVSAGAANSADVVVTSTAITVALKGNAAPIALSANNIGLFGTVDVRIKDDAGLYWTIDSLHSKNKPALIISGPGTYQFFRANTGVAVGVFSA